MDAVVTSAALLTIGTGNRKFQVINGKVVQESDPVQLGEVYTIHLIDGGQRVVCSLTVNYLRETASFYFIIDDTVHCSSNSLEDDQKRFCEYAPLPLIDQIELVHDQYCGALCDEN